ncbi:MAG: PfkB family carbohydrate kinase, partial [Chlorobiales bacterium]|nr:PfkB family carbohydrate kinase [Chlorobiales bacterium]
MERFTAIGIGEMLWDMLPEGKKLGGAPSNFAFQFNALGGYGVPFSRLGDDDLGKEARALLESHGVDTAIVGTDPDHPSGRVDVTVDADGVPSYIFPPDVAWDFIEADPAALELASRANAASFGTLAQRSEVSRASIRAFIEAMPGNALRIFDI